MNTLTAVPETLPPGFAHQIEAVNQLTCALFTLATRDEWMEAARALNMTTSDGKSVIVDPEGDPGNARVVEWAVFCIRRNRVPLVRAVAGELAPTLPVADLGILEAMCDSHWALLRVEAVRPGIGMVMTETWTGIRRVVYTERLSRNAAVGGHLVARPITVAGCTTLTALIATFSAENVAFMERTMLPTGRSLAAATAADPVMQEAFARQMFSLKSGDDQVLVDMARGNRSRNQPCPCGSGRKFKHCHGR